MKNCCRKCCCAIFCCTCCRKTPLNVINNQTKLLPINDDTKNELETKELYVFGTAPPELRKVLLEGYGEEPVKKIECGKSHCIILLNDQKRLIGFGSNAEGQLGLSLETKTCSQITQLSINVPNLNMQNSTITDIAAGDDYSLILVNTEGEDTLIRFGTDIINKYVNIPNTNCQKIEKLPELNSKIKYIYAFEKRKMFYTEDNEIYVGGRDFSGTEIDEYLLLKKFDKEIKNIYLQKESCIVENEDGIYGLGDNSYKELGLGNNFSMNDFTKLPFKFKKKPNEQKKIKKISCGARHLLFLLEDGEIYCVGDNSEGQCCGATSSCSYPVKLEINSKSKIVDCYSGYNHNLIILENGSVYTWGNTANGKLGYFEDKFTQDTPKEILGLKIKYINKVCLGYQLTVIATGKEDKSIVFKKRNKEPKINNNNELQNKN